FQCESAQDLDDASERVESCRRTVLPIRARLEIERQRSCAFDALCQRSASREIGSAEKFARWSFACVGESRCVRQQILQRDLAIGQHEMITGALGIARQIPDGHFRILEFWYEF